MKIVFLHRFREDGANEHEFGGAERQLVDLARGLAEIGHDIVLITFYDGGELISEADRGGVRVVSMGKSGRWDVIPFFARTARALRRERPDITHGYLGLANALLVLFKPLHRGKVVWGVRSSDIDLSRYSWIQKADAFIEKSLGRFPDLIIANSYTGKKSAVQRGFPDRNFLVIHNGIRLDKFRFDSDGRRRLRAEWGVAEDEILVGRVGRRDPQKDHTNFIQSAALVGTERPNTRFVLIGVDPPAADDELAVAAARSGLGERLIFAGRVLDMPAAYSALDRSVSSSAYGEGTPNVVAESMACGIPCIVTDVGDSAFTVGVLGEVVPRQDSAALAAAILTSLDKSHDREALRAHVREHFSYEHLISRTQEALARLIDGKRVTP